MKNAANKKGGEKMSELNPSKKTEEVVSEILKLCEKAELTVEEIADVPSELSRRIDRNINKLIKKTVFKLLP